MPWLHHSKGACGCRCDVCLNVPCTTASVHVTVDVLYVKHVCQ
jgi:hypothetical protein